MTTLTALYESHLPSLKLIARGKVRDIYDIDNQYMLIVTTDRLSAFDVILPNPIPDKGRVLTTVSNFWFNKLRDIIPNHLTHIPLEDILKDENEYHQVAGRAIIVKKLTPLPVEAIVRGYLIGSGWKDYQKSGQICGIQLSEGLQQAQQLPEPIFTPSTKAAVGEHDENVSFEQVVALLGRSMAEQVRDVTLKLYKEASAYAKERGIIIADTKFEFGVDHAGTLHLIDEILTPDSSRFWDVKDYKVGTNPPSFDKQYVRDYLESLDWDKTPPAPELPAEVADVCAKKYHEAEVRLTH
ncbi:MAG: phosphoribosylaminoimidazolesuccinocarboxamide synthase [Methylococcales bacterium]|nr:phosphoribosylaminoimidazolesuccinocarboxamide synthase [Methylococcales bacterium]